MAFRNQPERSSDSEAEQHEMVDVDIGQVVPASVLVRFDDTAKAVLQFAIHECDRHAGHCVATHDILNAILRVGASRGSKALEVLGVSIVRARKIAEEMGLNSMSMVSIESISPLARRCLNRALRLCDRSEAMERVTAASADDLLLAILSEERSCAAQVLRAMSVEPSKVKEIVFENY